MANPKMDGVIVTATLGEPTNYVPSWAGRYDLSPAIEACKNMAEGEWLPVTLEDISKATGYQHAANKMKIFNILRRKNIVYLQLIETNGENKPESPAAARNRVYTPSKRKGKLAARA